MRSQNPSRPSGPEDEREAACGPEEPGASVVEISADTKSALADLPRRLAEAEDKRLRALAELDNARKRFAREIEQTRERERDLVLCAWLDVVDNCERALAASDDSANVWRQGVEAILQQMQGVLRRFGVEPFGAPGEKFDPALHEAVAAVDDPQLPAGSIRQVALKGYRMGNRILRPAKVIAVRRPDAGG